MRWDFLPSPELYNRSQPWSDEHDTYVLYFSAMGVNTKGIMRLVKDKCDVIIKQDKIRERVELLMQRHNLYGLSQTRKQILVGEFLAFLMPNPENFERIIKYEKQHADWVESNISSGSILAVCFV